MRDDSAIVAIEAALSSSSSCNCRNVLDIASTGGALWLECRSFSAPSRLPLQVATAQRSLTHDLSFVAVDPVDHPRRRAGRPRLRRPSRCRRA